MLKNGSIPQGLKYSIYGCIKKRKIEKLSGPVQYTIKYDERM